IVTSYAILLKDHPLLSKIDFNCVILDEAHYIKNRNSKIFEAVRTLKTEQRVSLSGTPIENSLADLWAQMEFINPDILGSYPEFKRNYQDPIEKNKDEEALNELKLILGPYILRRTRKEVLKDLPDLEEQVFYSVLPDPQMDLIEKEKSKARNELLQAEMDQQPGKLHVLNALLKLRQLANHPKLADPNSDVESGKFDDVLETLETLAKSGNKILVFSSFVSHLKLYEAELKLRNIKYVMLTGSDQSKDRELAVNRFQTDEKCSVFMISLKAGGTGLNLTSANYVLILDPWWNPFAESQAIGRSYRMGQSQKVTVIRFLAKDTIEEKIHALQLRKKDLAGQMMEEEMIPALDQETLEYLLD
ncbi:MAG TPA: DEAD/DEAH box helicase, partial [Saprospiraceae bacterium]|nr:DEAD/DEAH box helicase [Saprospiraceae bacterium]